MSFSDEYIKMVLSLPKEFFKDWVLKDGDAFILKEKGIFKDGDAFVLKDKGKWEVGYFGNVEVDIVSPVIFPLTETKLSELRGDITPLPSQKQLQERSTLDWWTFYSAIVHQSDITYPRNEPCECACLRQTMWILEGKRWNGEKWV